MPAKKQVSREAILKAALSIVGERGMEGLNVRAIAEKCKCSTQPIYLSFKGMDELKSELSVAISAIFEKFLQDEINSGKYPPYKATGMGYIRFAKERPQYFKYLFMRDRAEEKYDKPSYEEFGIAKILRSMGISGEDADTLHAHMWIFVHGIATMHATGFLDWDKETVGKMLTVEFTAITEKLNLQV